MALLVFFASLLAFALLNRIPQTVGNPGPETAVLFACKCDRWLSLQISLANLNLDTAADSLRVLGLDANEVTTELPGGFRQGREAGRLQLSSVSLHIMPPAGHGSCA